MRQTLVGTGLRNAFVVAALLSCEALAQEAAVTESDLSRISIEQLCAQRSNPEIRAEIERRGVFSDRDLRAIDKEKVRTGIDPAAISCFLGQPLVFTGIGGGGGSLVDRSTFELHIFENGDEATVVAVEHVRDQSTVVDWHRTDRRSSYRALLSASCSPSGCTFPGGPHVSPRDSFPGQPFGPGSALSGR